MKKFLSTIALALISASTAQAQGGVSLPTQSDLPKRCLEDSLSRLSGEDLNQSQGVDFNTFDGSRVVRNTLDANQYWIDLSLNTSDLLGYTLFTKLSGESKRVLRERGEQLVAKYQGNYFESVIPALFPESRNLYSGNERLTVTCLAKSCGGFNKCRAGTIDTTGTLIVEKINAQVKYLNEVVELARIAGVPERRIRKTVSSFNRIKAQTLRATKKVPSRLVLVYYSSN